MRYFKQNLSHLVTSLLGDLFPSHCPRCNASTFSPHSLCDDCWEDLEFIPQHKCICCGFPFPETAPLPHTPSVCASCYAKPPQFDKAVAPLSYNNVSRDLILKYKHGDQLHLTPLLTNWLKLSYYEFQHEEISFDLIIPIPLHWKRRLYRRYNQAALMANALAKSENISLRNDILRRQKATASQGHLSLLARQRNLKNAFKIPKGKRADIKDKTILLVDDVFTTGSTVDEAARILKKHGAKRVSVLTIARVIRPQTPQS